MSLIPASIGSVYRPVGKPDCACCVKCDWDARAPGRCPYGGPFTGYQDAQGLPISPPEEEQQEPANVVP